MVRDWYHSYFVGVEGEEAISLILKVTFIDELFCSLSIYQLKSRNQWFMDWHINSSFEILMTGNPV